MSNDAEQSLPHVSFALDELKSMERILWAYHAYLQRGSPTKTDVQQLQKVERLRAQLEVQLATGNVLMCLTVDDTEELVEAMNTFSTLIQRMFPHNEQRTAAVAAIKVWCVRLESIMSEFGIG